MEYVKLINGVLEYAPKNKGSILNYNINTELMLQDGYKPLISVQEPQTNRFYHIEYSETENNIEEIIVFDETEEQAEERIAQTEKEQIIAEINQEIIELEFRFKEIDIKRIRAICEPSVKDETTGQTWLAYYNAQILDLRSQIQTLQERINQYDIT